MEIDGRPANAPSSSFGIRMAGPRRLPASNHKDSVLGVMLKEKKLWGNTNGELRKLFWGEETILLKDIQIETLGRQYHIKYSGILYNERATMLVDECSKRML